MDGVVDPAAYRSADFALCYVCHGEAPFGPANAATAAEAALETNFPLHSEHLNLLTNRGDKGTDIDKAGDGQGNAICAECHFRLHSTTYKVGTQDVGGTRLVNFAPDVQPYPLVNGVISWTPKTATAPASCTLTCHGVDHDARTYGP